MRGLLGKLEAKGLTAAEARDSVDVGLNETLSLGELLGVAEGFKKRVELVCGRGEFVLNHIEIFGDLQRVAWLVFGV